MQQNGWKHECFVPTLLQLIVNFLYKYILFGLDSIDQIVTNQGTHFISYVIRYLTNHFSLAITILLFTTYKETFKLSFTN
jgi:hypothetical protein